MDYSTGKNSLSLRYAEIRFTNTSHALQKLVNKLTQCASLFFLFTKNKTDYFENFKVKLIQFLAKSKICLI